MIRSASRATRIAIVGHGLTLPKRYEIAAGIALSPTWTAVDLPIAAAECVNFRDYAAVVNGQSLASFSIEVEDETGGEVLAVKGWNALWIFHLLSVACRVPCFSLYSHALDASPAYSNANRHDFLRPVTALHLATFDELQWAKTYRGAFDTLIRDDRFSRAMRSFANAQYLPDHDMRIMLLWSGIEGILAVDAELSRRVALYAAIVLAGSKDEKVAHYERVRKAYGVRSRVVHGASISAPALQTGLENANLILITLLRRCVELGRIPTAAELDSAAASQTID